MSKELIKRIITSLFLLSLLVLVIYYNYILIISLIIISLISWIEFNGLIAKIFIKKNFEVKFFKTLSLLYLTFFSIIVFNYVTDLTTKGYAVYIFCICIFSDVGGLIFGKLFGGKKLTKISPNKTISGSIGSFAFSLLLVPLFFYFFSYTSDPFFLILFTIIISITCQLGDLFISFLKRKANVKDTGDLLPGHGGVLDRMDGILFAVPIGLIILSYLLI
ncbi:phosphatidate cytidylyltransferase [Candidatus Pelagibacter sp.]|jgi:phosphatidate cytidylyltransferase|nr:phosphatidate cytidylyltransferase [Candidatus Pelagibacter sp.]|tara:strand:- start:682 stop:1338 length:657 start_codon:yes stop_codon:yes gene_type:complete